MSNIFTTVAAGTQRLAKARRTIRNSPDFGDDRASNEDGTPVTRIPTGGFLTG